MGMNGRWIAIFKQILESLKNLDFKMYKNSLICSEKALKNRLQQDVERGIREPDVINRSSNGSHCILQ